MRHQIKEIAASGETSFALPYVRAAGVWLLNKGQETPLRRIYDHELVYVVSGAARITLGEQSFLAQADSLFLVQPKVWHSYCPEGDAGMTQLGIHFDWDEDAVDFHDFADVQINEAADDRLWRMPRSIAQWDNAQTPLLHLGGRPRVRHLMSEVVAMHALGTAFSTRQAAALLAAALFQIAEEAGRQSRIQAESSLSRDTLQRIHQACDLLESPDSSNRYRTSESVASQVGWSADHLRRVLRLATGATPVELQNTARIARAQELLKEGRSIGETATRCGFSDAAYFSRVFKKYSAGLSPRAFTLQHRPAPDAWVARLRVAPSSTHD